MQDKTLIELRTALFPPHDIEISVNRGNDRILQVYSGLEHFFIHLNKFVNRNNLDVIFIDNTIQNETDLPKEILDILVENSVQIYPSDKNNYGRKNKGAGDIEVWREYYNKILGYRWFLHFEPRTIMKSPDFIKSFFFSPRNLFKVFSDNVEIPHFYTGIFCIESKKLKDFIDSINLEDMVNSKISIEYAFKDFMDNTNTEYSDYSDKLNIIWHDAAQNRLHEF